MQRALSVRHGWKFAVAALLLLLSGTALALGPSQQRPPAEPFLGPADFQGSFVPRTGSVMWGLQSTYRGTVVLAMADRDVVARMLPPGLSLAQPLPRPDGTIPTRHPVLHMIGDQRQPALVFNGTATPPIGTGYQEMIWIVPFVVRGTASEWHNFVVRMYLDEIIPVIGGNEYFGYAKVLAHIQGKTAQGTRRYEIATTDLVTTWFEDALRVPSGWASPPPARWQDVRAILAMPMLGLRPASLALPDLWLCSYWELDFAKAKIAPTTSRHRVVTAFVAGMQDWETMGAVDSARDGAFAMREVRWRLAAAQSC